MLAESERTFDLDAFDKKLKHYFSDSAPCLASYKLGLRGVEVRNTLTGKKVFIPTDETKTVKECVANVVKLCEENIYPILVKETVEKRSLTVEEKKLLISRGTPVSKAVFAERVFKTTKYFFLTRVSLVKNTLVLRESGSDDKYLFKLKFMPVGVFLHKLLTNELNSKEAYDRLERDSESFKIIPNYNQEKLNEV